MSNDMRTVTHVAGPVVAIGNRAVQRCALCGEKLLDNLNQAAPMNPDGTPPKFCTWEQAALVQFTVDTNPRRELLVGDFRKDILPADFCLRLVE